jgi:GT2 family glycosyltransferase
VTQGHDPKDSAGEGGRPIAHAAWLADALLLLSGRFEGFDGDPVEAKALLEGKRVPLDARSVSFPASREQEWNLLACGFPADEQPDGEPPALEIQSGDAALAVSGDDLSTALTDLRTLLRDDLADLDAVTRARLVEFIAAAAAPYLEGRGGFSLGKRLHMIREALREPLTRVTVLREEPQGMAIDRILAVDDRSFWVKGWLRDQDSPSHRLEIVSPEGSRGELVPGAFRYERPDIKQFYGERGEEDEKDGFVRYVRLSATSALPTGWVAELRNDAGAALETSGPEVMREIRTVRDLILQDLALEGPQGDELTLHQAYPALSRIQEQMLEAVDIKSEVQYGKRAASPEVTIVVPLYKRIDLLEHQMSEFVHDPQISESDLVYVLDSPEQDDDLAYLASEMARLYGVPFRVVTLTRNGGFSAATNVGASCARGRKLLLLNSDVLPDKPGWLQTMVSFYDATPDIGALGPKLLYEDDSLQHAGLYFYDLSLQHAGVYHYMDPGSSIWQNEHYFKGLHRDLPAANVARQVGAVTAACLMVDRKLFEEVGGLRGVYVQGGYEDSDLCLRLLEAGCRNWYLPDAELYHLEDQSYPSELRELATKYNMWLHTHLWNQRIQELMAEKELNVGSPTAG